jgi:hypothetical protein
MKFAAVIAFSLGAANAQRVCDIIPGMVSIDTQNDECCGAAIILVTAGAIGGGMGGMLGGECSHMQHYSQYFPEGCTDCNGPNDSGILKCTAGSSPKLEVLHAARHVACCNVYTDYGGSCQSAIINGAKTGAGAMNGQVIGGFDANKDNLLDLCSEFACPTDPPPTDPCVCQDYWKSEQFNPNCVNQQGCPAEACDNDLGGPWCKVVNPGCDGSWAKFDGDSELRYCSPPVPTDPPPTAENCRDCADATANRSLLFARLPCCSN